MHTDCCSQNIKNYARIYKTTNSADEKAKRASKQLRERLRREKFLGIRVVSPSFPFAPESFRPLSLSPRVVSPPDRFAHSRSPLSRFAHFPFVPESFRETEIIKFYFCFYYFGLKNGIKLWFSCLLESFRYNV